MKNLKLILLAIVVSLAGVSCSSDDDSDSAPVVNNVMELSGQQYDIDSALLESYGESGDDGSYDWDVSFYTEGFSYDSETGEVVGTGAALLLDLNTNSAGGLVPGIYTYSPERAEFKWVFAVSGTNIDTANDSGDFIYSYSQGTVTITGTDDDQTITVDLSTEDGETTATASYQGSFQFVDYSTTKKNKKK